MRILIADDSAIVRERLAVPLSHVEGIDVIGQAQNGSEAIAAIPKLRPDVLILDISMPQGTGYDVLEHVKKNAPSTIVSMLTNYACSETRTRCLEAGADFFLDKSTEFEKVTEVIKGLMRR